MSISENSNFGDFAGIGTHFPTPGHRNHWTFSGVETPKNEYICNLTRVLRTLLLTHVHWVSVLMRDNFSLVSDVFWVDG